MAALSGAVDPAAATPPSDENPNPDRKRPNVLLYVADTLRADSLGRYGNTTVATPSFDALAREGALYENVYASSTWTRASVASILTGIHPTAHGSTDRPQVLSERLSLLAELFRDQGYATAAIVANPNAGSFYGFDQGWDVFVELYEDKQHFKTAPNQPGVLSDTLNREAIAWLETVDRPFFLFMLPIDPHWPYRPPDGHDRYRGDYRGRVDGDALAITRTDLSPADKQRVRSLYDAEVTYNDSTFGELMSHLASRGEKDDTVIVFTSDHGEEFWEHGATQHGTALFEETLRVPLIIRYPSAMPVAARISEPVQLVDIAATLVDLAGLEPPYDLAGRSLRTRPNAGDRSLHATLALDGEDMSAITDPPWKLIRNHKTGDTKLFDLEHDPGETWNQAAQHPARVAALSKRLDAAIAADVALHARIHAGASGERMEDAELPDEARKALEALGYIEPGESPP